HCWVDTVCANCTPRTYVLRTRRSWPRVQKYPSTYALVINSLCYVAFIYFAVYTFLLIRRRAQTGIAETSVATRIEYSNHPAVAGSVFAMFRELCNGMRRISSGLRLVTLSDSCIAVQAIESSAITNIEMQTNVQRKA
ncbi:unnamed protein product, partial [Soboliphyme baturini]|uniref:G protein-coupled receptor n=1 Tax=Soboliphyme baturini TaxID=241478 RepID=A0A183JB28_9BILA